MRWLATGLLALCWAGEVWGGAWSQPRGGYYAKLSGIHYSTAEVFKRHGQNALLWAWTTNQFRARQVLAYGEYGLRERLTLTGQVGAGRLVSEDRFVERITWGLGDVHLGAKYQLTGGRLVLSPQGRCRVPQRVRPRVRSGSWDWLCRTGGAAIGGSVALSAAVLRGCRGGGYKRRGGPFSNQVSYFVELGATPLPWLFAKGFVASVYTLSAADSEGGLVGVVQVSEGDFAEVGANAAVRVAGPLWIDLLWKVVFKRREHRGWVVVGGGIGRHSLKELSCKNQLDVSFSNRAGLLSPPRFSHVGLRRQRGALQEYAHRAGHGHDGLGGDARGRGATAAADYL